MVVHYLFEIIRLSLRSPALEFVVAVGKGSTPPWKEAVPSLIVVLPSCFPLIFFYFYFFPFFLFYLALFFGCFSRCGLLHGVQDP
jgi:hypothetical protein